MLLWLNTATQPTLRASRASVSPIRCSGSDSGLLALFVVAAAHRPSHTAELALRAAGVSGLIVRDKTGTAESGGGLPVLWADDLGDETALVGSSGAVKWRAAWLGRAASASSSALELQEAAAELPATQQWMASLPAGAAASLPALRRATLDAWMLRTVAGCGAIVLSFDELRRAAAGGGGVVGAETSWPPGEEESLEGWAPVVRELARMRRPVSAVDYPPSVFMIGEDEARTTPEVV